MNWTFKDISGKRFGRLVAIEPTKKRVHGNGCIVWRCQCDCGNIHYVNGNALRSGHIQGCGCGRSKKEEI